MENKIVYVEVSGGVAECTESVPGVGVEIIDWDNIRDTTQEENRKNYSIKTQQFIYERYPEGYRKYFGDALPQ